MKAYSLGLLSILLLGILWSLREALHVEASGQMERSSVVASHRKTTEAIVHHSQATGVTQKILYGAFLDPKDPHWLRIRNYSSVVAATPNDEYLFSAVYEIIHVAHRSKDNFFVLGRTASGEDVVEQWKRKKTMHVGSPSYELRRTELYRGAGLGGVRTIGADGYGRYLMIAHGNPLVVSQMDVASATISQVYDSGEIPELNDWTAGLFPRLHATQGMVWSMTLEGQFLVMVDLDDDASIDTWSVLGPTAYYNEYGFNGPILNDFTTNQ